MKRKCHYVPQGINVENVKKREFTDIVIQIIYAIRLDICI